MPGAESAEERSRYFSELATHRHAQRIERDREAADVLARLVHGNRENMTDDQVVRAHDIIRRGCKHYRPELDG